jgi:uncharacterized repeat protein (TIGR02543 family)
MDKNDTPQVKTERASAENGAAGGAEAKSARPASRWKFGRGVYEKTDVPIRALDIFIFCVIGAILLLGIFGALGGGFRVNFDTGVSGVTIPTQRVRYGHYAVEPEAPVRPGYTLACWSTDAQEVDKWGFAYRQVTGDMTLYAVWAPALVTVRFDLDGGTVNGAESVPAQTVTYAESYGALPVPVKEGRTFAGWSYSGQIITSESTVTATGEHVLTALWQ